MAEKGLTEVSRALREQFEKGLAAIQKNNLDYAVALLSAVLEQEPGFYPAREALRDAQLRRTGNRGLFKRILGTAGNSPLLARAQLEIRSNPRQAMVTAEQILTADPQSTAAHRILADAALELGFPKTAVLSLQMAFKQSPDRELVLKLAEALMGAGQAARAETVLMDMVKAFPGDPEIGQLLKDLSARRTLSEGGYGALEGGGGSYRDILKDKDEAVALEQEKREVKTEAVAARLIREYEAQLRQEPRNLRLLRSIAELYVQQGDHDRALEYYERVAGAEGGSEPALEQAITATLLRRFDARLAALDAGAGDFETAKAQLESDRNACELERARKLAEQYPTDLALRFDLGQVLFRQNRIAEAIQEFQKAQGNPHKRLQCLYHLGLCFERRGVQDLAVRSFQAALREKTVFDDEKKALLYALGTVLDRMGRGEEAIEQFKLIYESDIGYRDVAAKVDAYYSRP